ncbi:MAG: ATP-binding protein [Clostridia bacterium]|nr:ATP-binding protein [Clostridia bacterium]
MEKIFRVLDNNNLMIATGVRRAGKSCIAKQLEDSLHDIFRDRAQVLRFNFEKINSVRISADDLISNFEQQHSNSEKCFVLLDEITHVIDWEKAVNHISQTPECKLILFSSNLRIISKELKAVRENRYDVIQVLPLSLNEFIQFQEFKETTSDDTPVRNKQFVRMEKRRYTLEEIYEYYISYGGLPILKPEYMDEERAWVIADGSYSAVVTRDILELGCTHGIKAITDPLLLRTIITIMAESIGDNISATWVGKRASEYLQRPVSTKTVESYMRALINAQLFYIAERYDIRAERTMQTLAKYYIVDAGLHNYVTGIRAEDKNRLLENKVFFELLRRGYQVRNGKRWQDEICLIAHNDEEKVYIQIANRNDSGSLDHLIAILRRIPDDLPKVIIAFDVETKRAKDGTIILNALEFLMGRSWKV